MVQSPHMRPIAKRYLIRVPAAAVWDALVSTKTINAWGGGPAKMNGRKAQWWQLWGGDVCGRNLQVVKGKKLVQEWYGGDWDAPSKVVIALKPTKTGTIVTLRHAGVPKEEHAGIRDGWDDYYFGPMKEFLERKKKA